MKINDKTLADVQPGGRVRLGDGLPPLPKAGYVTGGDFGHEAHNAFTPEQMREYALAALSAQPSPGGQGDARAIIEEFIQCATLGRPHGKLIAQAKDYLAARQPVGEITDTEIDARLNALYREMVDSGQHNGGMSGVAWDRAVYRMASGSPAQAVDLGTGVKAIAVERERQLQAEGFTRDGDQQYRQGELARAATAYVQLAAMDLRSGTRGHIAYREPPFVWPWAAEWWKPVDARRDLVRAGALIAAQIDLIDSKAVGNGN